MLSKGEGDHDLVQHCSLVEEEEEEEWRIMLAFSSTKAIAFFLSFRKRGTLRGL